MSAHSAPAWVAGFYDRKSELAGPSGVHEHHHERASAIARLTGVTSGRVLELGCGAGGAPVATAQLGYDVVAVELSPVRAGFARDLVAEHGVGVEVVEGDFLTLDLEGRFDAVVCWDGFGVGDDAQQRALLRRVAEEWLAPGGVLALDVYNPVAWARWAGEEETDEETGLLERLSYDAVGSRFVDQWFFDGVDAAPLEQSVRCYSPADFRLLCHDLPFEIEVAEWLEGEPAEAYAWRAVLRAS